ncbi:MAG: electron transfer flavoprotein subunit beta/FixA family protein [Deltaproteobacteria bacterium]|nr:electron transfer flavoprotein subunit beta/FixA family protein [Deltaproteobacteria bacterium]
MKIVVCVKRVPLTQEVDLALDPEKRDVRKDNLAHVINEWDNYAVEEAVRIKEKAGGEVIAVTVGREEDEEVLRRCLAMGADSAVRVDPDGLEPDAFVIARILAEVIGKVGYDLVLTGVQADDLNEGAVGILAAEYLGISRAAVVTGIEPEGEGARVRVELEGGTDEMCRIPFPALLSVQTGINEPRYVSIMGIRKAAKKELRVVNAGDLGLPEEELQARTTIEEVFFPPETGGAEILEGDPSRVAEEIIRIVREKGVNL